MEHKRPRPEDICEQQLCARTRPKLESSTKFGLLSLPNEPLYAIFCYLGARDTRGSFQGPRHAFALAQTNHRMLRLFSNLLTHITPDTANPTPPALSPSHLLSVARLAGTALRELHLPDGCSHILSYVAQACPRLEILSVVDNPNCRKTGLASLLCLVPLRSLTINNPSLECLRLLHLPPPDLTLNNVLHLCSHELIRILRNPPKRLNLVLNYKGFTVQPWLTKLLASLAEVIPKMETVSVVIPFCVWHPREDFAEGAAHLIAAVRRNDTSSKCMFIKLEGEGTFRLLKRVHPNAKVEITRWGQMYADYGDGLYPQQLPIDETFVTTDLSRLKNLMIMSDFNPQWKTVLHGLKLDRLEIHDVRSVPDMCLSFDTIEMHVTQCRWDQWGWLGNAREVRIVGIVGNVPTVGWILFFEALASLLDQFHGKVVWVRDIGMKHFAPSQADTLAFRSALTRALTAVERFEERDGDAGTVRSLIDRLGTVRSLVDGLLILDTAEVSHDWR